ncbi:MAG: 50S ribosome-binding GTPase [Candidatus Micrarchaeota archaeon]|nr:50S ribosome-binding GTPase [Candidatus Micrarchaeota archaeon]
MADKKVLEQKLEELQEQYSKTKYNKATNKYLGILRSKMAKVRRTLADKRRRKGEGFAVKKTGDATVVMVGFPNAGKSSLLGRLTSAESKVANYAFTTLDVIPGIMEYEGARIQLLDVPGLIEGAHTGKGAGTQIASVMRVADLLLFVVDATSPEQIDTLIEELSLLDIKVNREKPKMLIEERRSGGTDVEANRHKVPSREEVEAVMHETGRYNCKVIFYSDMSIDELISVVVDNAVYTKGVIALNKVDLLSGSKTDEIRRGLEARLRMRVVPVSAETGTNLDRLRELLFSNLGLMRIYLKPKDGEADYARPFVLKNGGTVMELAKGLHTKAAKNFKHAYVTGKSARFENQRVGGEHVLMDGDVVTLVYEKF